MPPRSAKKVPIRRPARAKNPEAEDEVLPDAPPEEILETPASIPDEAAPGEEDDGVEGDEKPVEENGAPAAAIEEEASVDEEVRTDSEAVEAGDVVPPPAVKVEGAGEAVAPPEENEEPNMSSLLTGEVAGDDEEAGDDEDPEEVEEHEKDSGQVARENGVMQGIDGMSTPGRSNKEGPEKCGSKDDIIHAGDGQVDDGGGETDDDVNDEPFEDDSSDIQASLAERKKQKEIELFIGGIDKKATEEDLIQAFSAFGEVQSARIIRVPSSQKSKGFGFIQYANADQARKVLAELKDGIEIRGKRAGVSASGANDTLFLGNICKTWTKTQVLETLESLKVERVDEILLHEDPKNDGKHKGFAFIEFGNHSDAIAAFQRLRLPDAVFGCDRSARVAFAHSMMHVSEEAMLQVKTVYVEGIPTSWDEEKVQEVFKQYGEIESVLLSRKFSRKRRKDFGFVAFTSRENALACVEGINNSHPGEADVKLSANLARPQNKSRIGKPGSYGGFKVKKDGDTTSKADPSKINNNESKLEETSEKGKTVQNLKATKRSKKSKSFTAAAGSKNRGQDHRKQSQPSGARKRQGRNWSGDNEARPPKKPRKDHRFGNMNGRHSRHASASSHHHSDLAPHAGYLPAGRQGGKTFPYSQNRPTAYANQPRGGVARVGAGSEHSYSYPGQSSYPGYQAPYPYPNSASYPYQRQYY